MHTIIPHPVKASNDADTPTPNFNPEHFPILATHWFGLDPNSQTSSIIDFEVTRVARALHTLGVGVGADVGNLADVHRRLGGST